MGRTYKFDGDNDYVDFGTIPTGHQLQMIGGGTAMVIFKWQGGPDSFQRLFDKSNGGGGQNGYYVAIDNNPNGEDPTAVERGVNQSTTTVGGNIVNSDVWYNLMWVFPSDELYLDGVEMGDAAPRNDPVDVATGFRFGSWNHSTAREFNGEIAAIALWKRTLSNYERRKLVQFPFAPIQAEANFVFPAVSTGGIVPLTGVMSGGMQDLTGGTR